MEKIQCVFPAHCHYGGIIRTFVNDTLMLAKVNELWRHRLLLVVDELFMNAVHHGSASKKDPITLEMVWDKHQVKISVEDMGKGKKHLSPSHIEHILMKERARGISLAKKGRGLPIIASTWTDHVDITEGKAGGLRFTVTKYIRQEAKKEKKPSFHGLWEVREAKPYLLVKVRKEDHPGLLTFLKKAKEKNFTITLSFLDWNEEEKEEALLFMMDVWSIVQRKKGSVCLQHMPQGMMDYLKARGLHTHFVF